MGGKDRMKKHWSQYCECQKHYLHVKVYKSISKKKYVVIISYYLKGKVWNKNNDYSFNIWEILKKVNMRQFTNYSLKIRCFIFFGFSIYVSIIHNMLKCKKGKKNWPIFMPKMSIWWRSKKIIWIFPASFPFQKCK